MLLVALWIATGIVVYCLVCWVVGYTLVYLGKVHDDLIPGATIYAPLMPIAFLSILVKEKIIFGAKVRLYQRTAKWIAEELKKKGIELHSFGFGDKTNYFGYNALHESCEVQANLQPKDVEVYRDVYARAIKKFSWRLAPSQLCGGAHPEWPLNREWAISIGISEYFAEHFIPCLYCNNKRPMGWCWGNDVFHVKPHDEAYNYSLKRTYHCADGNDKTFHGWICEDCESTRVGRWVSMSGN